MDRTVSIDNASASHPNRATSSLSLSYPQPQSQPLLPIVTQTLAASIRRTINPSASTSTDRPFGVELTDGEASGLVGHVESVLGAAAGAGSVRAAVCGHKRTREEEIAGGGDGSDVNKRQRTNGGGSGGG